jgi:hemerythrin-like domain-containing protein
LHCGKNTAHGVTPTVVISTGLTMNEKIKQLADYAKAYANQCTKDIDGDVSWHWMDYYTEKFAELIVRECTTISDKDSSEPCASYGELIKRHFGVEE